MTLTRRALLATTTSAALAALIAPAAFARVQAKLVIIGGGFGGATAARALKRLMPNAEITLVERNRTYTACPFSNLVIGDTRTISAQQFQYAALETEGIGLVQMNASAVDLASRTVKLDDGAALPFDRLIMAPGIDMRWNALEGYDEAAAQIMPHAWKAGSQTSLLQQQLAAMPDGGLVILSAPAAPFRCPPGPYERASLIAHYLKTQKPKSKLILLDAKDSFSKQPLFEAAWAARYPDHLEWRGVSNDGRVARVNAEAMTVETDFETFKPAVANIIPPQKAGAIAHAAGVTDATGWCPINATSFESTLQQGIHVIGDAAIANPMPKSAFSANLQGKLCAIQVARLLSDLPAQPTTLANTCYSFVAPDAAVSIAGVYRNDDGIFADTPDGGGLTPLPLTDALQAAEAAQANDWFNTITRDSFG